MLQGCLPQYKVPCFLPVLTLFNTWTQCFGYWCVCFNNRCLFTYPGKVIAFFTVCYFISKFLFQLFKVYHLSKHTVFIFLFCDNVREEFRDSLYVSLHYIRCLHFKFIQCITPKSAKFYLTAL